MSGLIIVSGSILCMKSVATLWPQIDLICLQTNVPASKLLKESRWISQQSQELAKRLLVVPIQNHAPLQHAQLYSQYPGTDPI